MVDSTDCDCFRSITLIIMSGHHQDWKEITIGKRPSATGSGGSAKAAKDPKAVAAVRARDDDTTTTRHDSDRMRGDDWRFGFLVLSLRWTRGGNGTNGTERVRTMGDD